METEVKKGTYLFFTAFLAGVLIANFFGVAWGRDTGAMGEYYMNRYLYIDISGRELFVYLFYQRIPRGILLFLLSFGIGIWILYGYIAYLGLSVGFLSVIAIICYGVKGILLIAGFLFPQWICYVPILFIWHRVLSEKRRWNRDISSGGYQRGSGMKTVFAAGVIALALCGLFLESYVNPFILKGIVRNM